MQEQAGERHFPGFEVAKVWWCRNYKDALKSGIAR